MTVWLKHLRTCRSSQNGLSLVEVLVSMIILAVGILSMAPMIVLSISTNAYSAQVSELASAAQQKIEERLGQETFATLPYVEVDSTTNERYRIISVVTDNTVDASIPDNVFRIDILVSWQDDAGVDRSFDFTTMNSKY